MKTIVTTLIFVLITFINFSSLHAQETNGYVIVEYMKVKPGMTSEYMECEGVWKKIHQYRKEKGHITGWELEQVLYPSGTHAEYDFITVTHYKDWAAMDAETMDQFQEYFNTLSEADSKIAFAAEDYRDLVKKEIWTAINFVGNSNMDQAKIRVENFMHLQPGQWDAWYEAETALSKQIQEKNVEMGNMAGWLQATMVLPRGENLPYHVSTLDMYESWEQMDRDTEPAFKAAFPNKSIDEINSQFTSARSLVKTEVRALIDHLE